MAMTLDQPARVVQLPPLLKRHAQRLDIGEALQCQSALRKYRHHGPAKTSGAAAWPPLRRAIGLGFAALALSSAPAQASGTEDALSSKSVYSVHLIGWVRKS
jgi:hypothetical protein